ncbi:hypothetical protein ACFXI8_02625 [Streptomyces niveus]|uniref:hypothetical protein n=1 Tax=Streptomyces niveus TaxID=193462 RepID=UPI0036949851
MNDVTDFFRPLQSSDPAVVAGYRLGAGGMGRVYLAHTRGGRPDIAFLQGALTIWREAA